MFTRTFLDNTLSPHSVVHGPLRNFSEKKPEKFRELNEKKKSWGERETRNEIFASNIFLTLFDVIVWFVRRPD